MPDFAGPLLVLQSRPQFAIEKVAVGSGVKLIEIYGVGAQRTQRAFQLLQYISNRKLFIAILKSFVVVAKLCSQYPLRSIVPSEIIPNEAFRKVIAVTLCCIDDIDSGLLSRIQNRVNF